jgi:cytidine deaminase
VSLQIEHPALDTPLQVLGRPQFSLFKNICFSLLSAVQGLESIESVLIHSQKHGDKVPLGFRFPKGIENIAVLGDWRIRSRDWTAITGAIRDQEAALAIMPKVTGIYFPILSILIPAWLKASESSASLESVLKKFLIFVTGSGTPANRDQEDYEGNDTFHLAQLMHFFVVRFFVDVEVSTIHSGPGLFSHKENIAFMRKSVIPVIARKRKQLADLFGDCWIDHFRLFLSLVGGSPARSQTLSAALKQFRPDVFHVSEVKTLWYDFPEIPELWDEDIEYLSFEETEFSPAVDFGSLEKDERLLVLEMMKHKQKFEHVSIGVLDLEEQTSAPVPREARRRTLSTWEPKITHELDSFWLRKTKQPVLSVLMVQKSEDENPRFFYGVNIEVSMPTGSLCAERSAIGSALAQDPTLKRKDMKAIAVLSLSLNSADYSRRENGKLAVIAKNPIAPCGACKEWLKKISAANPDFRVVMFESSDCSKVLIKPVG